MGDEALPEELLTDSLTSSHKVAKDFNDSSSFLGLLVFIIRGGDALVVLLWVVRISSVEDSSKVRVTFFSGAMPAPLRQSSIVMHLPKISSQMYPFLHTHPPCGSIMLEPHLWHLG